MHTLREHVPAQSPHILNVLGNDLLATDFIQRLKEADLSKAAFKMFVVQRLRIARLFQPLVSNATENARKMKLDTLEEALQRNLDDEDGIHHVTRQPHAAGNHEVWRRHFSRAVGIDDQDLDDASLFAGTIAYRDTVERLACSDLSTQLGAILYQEYSVPREFERIRVARNGLFPEKFLATPGDTRDIARTKRNARLYVDHHIGHDDEHHLPDLIKAITDPTSTQVLSFTNLFEGIQTMHIARMGFYNGLSGL